MNKLVGNRVAVMSLLLNPFTGILGNGILMGGIPWETLRQNAMKLQVPFDAVEIDIYP